MIHRGLGLGYSLNVLTTRGLLTLRSWLGMLALACCLAGCGGQVELVSGLSEAEANEALGALLGAAISASKVHSKEGVSINVEQAKVARAIEVLRERGLPRPRHARMGDVFKKENLISSPLEERARYLFALSQELEQTLSQIDDVIAARVHVVLPERVAPGDPTVPSSASVFIKYRRGSAVESVVPQVRTLVTNSISGLSEDKVSVILVPARQTTNIDAPLQWDTVLLFRVEQDSAPGLRALLVTLTVVILLAMAALLFVFFQRSLPHGGVSTAAAVMKRLRPKKTE
ncbi:MAG: type III secretion inner membrane ring lipoprotein SctJ [Pseudomonadota bacterium]